MSATASFPTARAVFIAQDDGGRWSQILVVAFGFCFVLNMLDGIGILMMSDLAPAITGDWSLGEAQLGVVFGAPLAGQFGRRRSSNSPWREWASR